MISSKLFLASFRILSIAIICGSNSCISIQDFSSIIFCIATFLGYNQRSLKGQGEVKNNFITTFISIPSIERRESTTTVSLSWSNSQVQRSSNCKIFLLSASHATKRIHFSFFFNFTELPIILGQYLKVKIILPEEILDIVFCIPKSFLDGITSSSSSDQSVSSGNSFHSIMLRQTFSTPIGSINPTGNCVNIPTKVSQKPIINWNKGVNQLTPDRTLISISMLTDLNIFFYLTDEKNII